jgi:hypothetical protein
VQTKGIVELAVKVVSGAVAFGALVLGVQKYFAEEDRALTLERDKFLLEEQHFKDEATLKKIEYELREDEVNRTFWDNRTAKCVEATAATGRIVAERATNASTIQTFRTLYYGPLAMFESQYATSKETSIETAMVRYRVSLDRCLADRNKCDWDSNDPMSLGHASVSIAHACTCLICSGFSDENKAKKIPECGLCLATDAGLQDGG